MQNKIIIFTLFAIALLANGVLASTPQPYTSDFSINLSPKNPKANSVTKAGITSYTFDTNTAHITWSVNNKIIKQGAGKKSVEFKTGNIGSITTLSVFIITQDKQEIEKNIKIKIGEIDLLWQAMTYTPSFYKGRAKPLNESLIKIVAIPHGLGARENLVYEWQRDYKNIPDASGSGKNSFTFTFSEIFNKETIKVKVSKPGENYFVEKQINIKAENPKILFYEEDPLLGIPFQKAIENTMSLAGKTETIIRAEPYFFKKNDLDSLSFNWLMNQKQMESFITPKVIGLSIPPEKGQATLQLEINNSQNFLESASASLKLNF